ncbi:hypothetical protein [Hymenobacter algoricola]|uniref:Uncharacterized protein n=1 Tax=Hymenobacter algoricola TaxID=486267 RepID=A0ABP7NQF9_9BACT
MPDSSAALAPAGFWRELPAAQVRRLGKPRLTPTRYRVLALDLPKLKKALAAADQTSGPNLLLPLPNGSQQAFQMRASSVLTPALAAKYPELRTYAGQAATPADYVRLEITPAGLRAMLVCLGRTYLIEPYRSGDTQHYLCFDKAALPAGSKQAFEIKGGPVR